MNGVCTEYIAHNWSAAEFCACSHNIIHVDRVCMVSTCTCIEHDYYLTYRESKERIGDVVSSIAPFLKVHCTCTFKLKKQQNLYMYMYMKVLFF